MTNLLSVVRVSVRRVVSLPSRLSRLAVKGATLAVALVATVLAPTVAHAQVTTPTFTVGTQIDTSDMVTKSAASAAVVLVLACGVGFGFRLFRWGYGWISGKIRG